MTKGPDPSDSFARLINTPLGRRGRGEGPKVSAEGISLRRAPRHIPNFPLRSASFVLLANPTAASPPPKPSPRAEITPKRRRPPHSKTRSAHPRTSSAPKSRPNPPEIPSNEPDRTPRTRHFAKVPDPSDTFAPLQVANPAISPATQPNLPNQAHPAGASDSVPLKSPLWPPRQTRVDTRFNFISPTESVTCPNPPLNSPHTYPTL